MPTVSCISEELYRLIGKQFTDEEFEQVCLSFGMELDEIIEEPERNSPTPVKTYKIEVGANRADLLCVEGIARALRVYLGMCDPETFEVTEPKITVHVTKETVPLRPYFVSAVVRNVTFNNRTYNSFIDHQDKLHQNICRRRNLVSMGTHDLGKMDPSKIVYTCEQPENIKFIALNQTEESDGKRLFELLRHGPLSEYLGLIESESTWPVIRDARGEVLSLPPIINSEYSKIDLNTKDVFIDITAKDLNRAHIALNALISALMFHSATPLTVEAVKVVYDSTNGRPLINTVEHITPNMNPRTFDLDIKRMSSLIGVDISKEDTIKYLKRMGVVASQKESHDNILQCIVSPLRADVLHEVDLIEDAAIGFGYAKIAEHARLPTQLTVGELLGSFQRMEAVRAEAAAAGYWELPLFTLCSADDKVFGDLQVQLLNAKTSSFAFGRASVIPGLLRAASHNQKLPLPLKLFEVGAVFVKESEGQDPKNETGASTNTQFGAIYAGPTDGFAEVHGLLERLAIKFGTDLVLKEENHKACIKNRAAGIYLNGTRVGLVGVCSVSILKHFKIPFPITFAEINLNIVEQIVQQK